MVVHLEVAQLVQHAVGMERRLYDALEVNHAETAMEYLFAAAFLFKDVRKRPIHDGVGAARILQVCLDDVGCRWQQVVHAVAAVGAGAPLGDVQFGIGVGRLLDDIADPL